MPKPLYIIESIDFGIFNGSISFSCGFKPKELIKHFKKHKAKEWAGGLKGVSVGKNCAGMAMERKYKDVHLYYLMLPKPFGFTDEEMITLAHECIHLVQFRLKDVLDRDREFECEAYLHTHLMSQSLKALRGK